MHDNRGSLYVKVGRDRVRGPGYARRPPRITTTGPEQQQTMDRKNRIEQLENIHLQFNCIPPLLSFLFSRVFPPC